MSVRVFYILILDFDTAAYPFSSGFEYYCVKQRPVVEVHTAYR